MSERTRFVFRLKEPKATAVLHHGKGRAEPEGTGPVLPGKGKGVFSGAFNLSDYYDCTAPVQEMDSSCGSERASLAVEELRISIGDENVFFSMHLLNNAGAPVTINPDFSLFDNKTDRRIPLSTNHTSRCGKTWTIGPDCGSGGDRISVKDLTALPAGTYRVEQEIKGQPPAAFASERCSRCCPKRCSCRRTTRRI